MDNKQSNPPHHYSKQQQILIRLLNQPEGKELLEYCKKFWDDEELVSPDVNKTYFNLGKRDAYRELYHLAQQGKPTNE